MSGLMMALLASSLVRLPGGVQLHPGAPHTQAPDEPRGGGGALNLAAAAAESCGELTRACSIPKVDYGSVCAPGQCRSTFQNLSLKYERELSGAVARAFAGMTGPAVLTISEWHTSQLLRNFLVHAASAAARDGGSMTVVDVALDDSSFQVCQAKRQELSEAYLRVVCLHLAGWLPGIEFAGSREKDRENGNANKPGGPADWSCIYTVTVWTKPSILRTAITHSSYPVALMDLDVVLHRNIFRYAMEDFPRREGTTLITASERCGLANTGVVYASNATLEIVNSWVQQNTEMIEDKYNGDQGAMWHILKQSPAMRQHWQVFPLSVVGQCGQHGEYATHYNCHPVKPQKMQRNGDWGPSDVVLAKIAAMRNESDWSL